MTRIIRPRMASVDDLTNVVERIERAVEVGTSPGVPRRIDSIRVRAIVEGALDKREKDVLEKQVEAQRGTTRHIMVGVITGVIMMICTAVFGYVTGRATAQNGAPASTTGHP
jgi:hypothetical protein